MLQSLRGFRTYLYLGSARTTSTARVDPRSTAKAGDVIKIGIDTNKPHWFDKETEKLILNR